MASSVLSASTFEVPLLKYLRNCISCYIFYLVFAGAFAVRNREHRSTIYRIWDKIFNFRSCSFRNLCDDYISHHFFYEVEKR